MLFRGAWQYAVVNASFDPDKTTPDLRPENGATWGVLIGAKDLLLYGRLERKFVPRVNMVGILVLVLAVVSYFGNRSGLLDRNELVRKIVLGLWAIFPAVAYIFLAGISGEGDFINPRTLITGLIVVMAIYGLLVWQKSDRIQCSQPHYYSSGMARNIPDLASIR